MGKLFALLLLYMALLPGWAASVEIDFVAQGVLSGSSFTVEVLFTLREGVYSESGSSPLQWGYQSGGTINATAGLYVSALQIIVAGSTTDIDVSSTSAATVAYITTSGSVLSLYLTSTSLASLSAAGGTGESFDIVLDFSGASFPTTGGELVTYFSDIMDTLSTTPTTTGSNLYFTIGGSSTPMALTPISVTVSSGSDSSQGSSQASSQDSGSGSGSGAMTSSGGSNSIEENQEFETQALFIEALLVFGIQFGEWNPSSFNISMTSVYAFGDIYYAFYNADDGELGIVVLSFGKVKVKKWGNGVHKGCFGGMKPKDLKSATGKSLGSAPGLTAQFYLVIARFDIIGNIISNVEMELEITALVIITYFYRFPEGSGKGKDVKKEGGSVDDCGGFCKLVIMIGTSTLSANTGESTGGAVKAAGMRYAQGLWALLLSAFYLLW